LRSVRWRYPLASAALALAFAVPLVVLLVRDSASSAEGFHGSEPPGSIAAPDFALQSYTGEVVRMRDLRDKAVAITFLDSQCEEACPIIAREIGRAVDLLRPGERRDVVAVAITTDPDEDTPRSVRAFLRKHRAEGKLDYLIGPERELRRVWKGFQILPSVETGNDEMHSAPVRIFDTEGVWVATLHSGADLSPENLAHDLRLALA
jgi:protein SCO1/2